jgi:hypothetical protein
MPKISRFSPSMDGKHCAKEKQRNQDSEWDEMSQPWAANTIVGPNVTL